MLYKTIVLELLQQQKELYEQLRTTRTLMATLERLANELKASHEAWKETLSQANPGGPRGPGGDPSQIASEAMEMAVEELENRLMDSTTRTDDSEAS